jgi:threonine dehydrogenase-like Zn-dependent dehydrogenase
MKAVIFKGLKSVEVVDLPTPVPGDNDVLLKNLYASICGSDVDTYMNGKWQEHRVTIGGEWGHECVSEVAAVGKNVKDLQVGDIVYPYPLEVKGDRRYARCFRCILGIHISLSSSA